MEGTKVKVEAIINPISGVGSKRKIPKMIEEACAKMNLQLHVSFTEYAGHASVLTRQALDDGASVILAVGGDGTVNEVARSMIHSQAVLGIVPKGSGNGLARDLHIPMDPKRALDIFMQNHRIVIDCCRANGRPFFCTCGVGFDAAVSQKFADVKRRGSITYVRKTVEEYLNYRPEVYELKVDDHTLNEKAFLVACANASQYGNNAFIAPQANFQDGEMDLTILKPFGPLDIAPLAIQLFTKQIDRNSKIQTMKAKRVSIIRQHGGWMHLDGEPVMADACINVTVEPQALTVFTPEKEPFSDEVYQFFGDVSRFFDKKLPYIFK
jgi:diacylglycerol kinase (ATP)